MKKIILWISAITRHLFSVIYPVNSPTYKATKLFKREPPQANAKPKNACMGFPCQGNCMRKAMPVCDKGKATMDLMNAFPQGPT